MWTEWTSCDWFCDEEDPHNKTRRLKKKETEASEAVAHLCNEKQVLGCYENCTGKVWIYSSQFYTQALVSTIGIIFLASPDALEVIVVSYSLTPLLIVSTDLTDVTLVSDDTY